MTHNMTHHFPDLGFGLGLRAKHYPYIFEHQPDIDWFEIISENFMDTDGRPKYNLARIREMYPIVMHGVSMSIGTVDPINSDYLHKLKALMQWLKPVWVSDHLCWTGVAHKNTHDLLPVPYTQEALKHMISRVKQVQDFLECPIALENPSTYLEFKASQIPEAEFLAELANESGCNLLLDVNNVYVSCFNHRLDPKAYLDALPLDKVVQMHLSGHLNKGTHIIDTHDNHVIDEVWELYKYVLHKAGRTPNTMIEWDDKIPDFPVLEAELNKARAAAKDAANHTLPQLAQEQIPQRANHTPTLHEAQNHMQSAIMLGKQFDSDPQSWIRSKEDFAPQAQLNVYVNAYRFRLYDVVAEDYSVLEQYLGEEAFEKLIWGFVNEAQPDHFNIARYAAKLPAYIKQQLAQDVFAQEMCELETIITQLSCAREVPALTQDDLAGMNAEKLLETTLYPREALQFATFTHNVNDYYQAHMDEAPAPAITQKTSHVAVFRHDYSMWRLALEDDEHALLQALFAGATIGQALDKLDEDAAENLTHWFSRWIRNGLLAKPPADNNNTERENHAVA